MISIVLCAYFHHVNYSDYFYYLFQGCNDFGIAYHAWQGKSASIAAAVYYLGTGFRPALRSGWLAYNMVYPAGMEGGAVYLGRGIRRG
jgi:hypothetical protein